MKVTLTLLYDSVDDAAAALSQLKGNAVPTTATTTQATSATPSTPSTPSTPGGATPAQLVELAKELASKHNKLDDIKAICQKYAVVKLNEVPPEKVQLIYAELKALAPADGLF